MAWDGANFIRTAQNLWAGQGYVGLRGSINVVHAPLYPLLIAALLPLVHDGERAGLLISVIAGSVFAGLVYGVTTRAFDARTGLLAGAIVAVHPVLVALSLDVLADQLALTLEFTGLYFLFQWLDRRRPIELAGCGVAHSGSPTSRDRKRCSTFQSP